MVLTNITTRTRLLQLMLLLLLLRLRLRLLTLREHCESVQLAPQCSLSVMHAQPCGHACQRTQVSCACLISGTSSSQSLLDLESTSGHLMSKPNMKTPALLHSSLHLHRSIYEPDELVVETQLSELMLVAQSQSRACQTPCLSNTAVSQTDCESLLLVVVQGIALPHI